MLKFTLFCTFLFINSGLSQFGLPFYGSYQQPQSQGNFQRPFQQSGFQQPSSTFYQPSNYESSNSTNNAFQNNNILRPQTTQSSQNAQSISENQFLQNNIQPTVQSTTTTTTPNSVEEQSTVATEEVPSRVDERVSQTSISMLVIFKFHL